MAMYSATADAEAIAAAGDMMEILCPTDAVIIIHAVYISQENLEADAANEQVTVSLNRADGSTSGNGGTVVTPVELELGGNLSGATVEANNTTDLTAGTVTIFHTESFSVLNGCQIVFTPETRPIISPADFFLLKLTVAASASVTFNYTVYYEELGG